jgi:hypothetical protein
MMRGYLTIALLFSIATQSEAKTRDGKSFGMMAAASLRHQEQRNELDIHQELEGLSKQPGLPTGSGRTAKVTDKETSRLQNSGTVQTQPSRLLGHLKESASRFGRKMQTEKTLDSKLSSVDSNRGLYSEKAGLPNKPRKQQHMEEALTLKSRKSRSMWLPSDGVSLGSINSHVGQSGIPLILQESNGKTENPILKEAVASKEGHRDLQLGFARTACMEEAQRLELLDSGKGYVCYCNAAASGEFTLICEAGCGEYCNDEGLVCGSQALRKEFQETGDIMSVSNSIEYRRGRDEIVSLSKLGCSDDGQGGEICDDCALSVISAGGGGHCNSCQLQTCPDGSQAAVLDCENIETGAVFDLCDTALDITGGVFGHLSANEFSYCVDPFATAKAACETDAEFFESMAAEKEYSCTCEVNAVDAVTLGCTATCGHYCDAEEEMCGFEVHDRFYDLSGTPYLVADNFFYTKGRTDRLSLVKRGCGQTGSALPGDVTCDECAFFVNLPQQCQSCSLQTCIDSEGNKYQAPLIDCQNIEEGAVFDLCDKSSISIDGGVFDYFSSEEYGICVDHSPENDVCSDEHEPLPTNGTVVLGSTVNAFDDGVVPCSLMSFSPGLWYKVVGTGTGLMASTCGPDTNFDTVISVYSGGCSDLRCVANNDDSDSCEGSGPSTVDWFGEEGVVYQIRVHGFDNNRGNFGLAVQETDIEVDICEFAAQTFESESDPISGTACSCEEMGDGSQTLSCNDACDHCNIEGDTCVSKSFDGIFDSKSVFHTRSITYNYTVGRSNLVVIEEANCTNAVNCETCRVWVDEQECNSCEYVECLDPFGMTIGEGKSVECGNIEPGANFNTCNDTVDVALGVFEALTNEEFDQCKRDPLAACNAIAIMEEEAGRSLGVACQCEDTGDSAILSCIESSCQYCNQATSVCAGISYGRIYFEDSDGGLASTYFEGYEYEEGRNDTLSYEETSDGCVFVVNGQECNSCAAVTCESTLGQFEGIEIDCENIEEGASYSDCGAPVVYEVGLFQVFSSLEFETCLEENDPESVCSQEMERHELSGLEAGRRTVCECSTDALTNGRLLTCSHPDCQYCNFDASVCTTKTFGVSIGRFGQISAEFDGFQYIEGGHSELVVVENFGTGCKVTVDGEECSSCELVTCVNEEIDYIYGGENVYAGKAIQCENVKDGVSFSQCDRVVIESGVFQVASQSEFDTCIQARPSEGVCMQEKAKTEALDPDTSCECEENEQGGHSITCVQKACLFCNANRNICGHDTIGKKFGRLGQEMSTFNGFQYIEGRNERIVFEPNLDPTDTRDCQVFVDKDECNNCHLLDCGGGFLGFDVNCENLPNGGSFNQCAPPGGITTGVSRSGFAGTGALEYFSLFEFNQCISVRDPVEVCEEERILSERDQADSGTECECEAIQDGGVRLSCGDTMCQYCNADETICQMDVNYGGDISSFGFFTSEFQTYDYILGRDERFVVEHSFENGCRVLVDGDECNSCEYISCADSSNSFNIQCNNVEQGAFYSGCAGTGGGFLQLMFDASFSVCVAFDGTFPHTGAATAAPEDQTKKDPNYNDGSGSGAQPASLSTPVSVILFGVFGLLTLFF